MLACPNLLANLAAVMSLHCCIVEDHCDVVPFLCALFATRLLSRGNFVHFDAHPDLSVASQPCSVLDFKNEEKVMAVMQNEGGISEFLLPLLYLEVLAHVDWVKPSWSSQFDVGDYKLMFGDLVDGTLGVTLSHPYYLDEGVVYDEVELQHARPLSFSVKTAEDRVDLGACWILDICLDYFSTGNPFLVEFRAALSAAECDVESASACACEFLACLRFRTPGSDAAAARELRREADALLRRLVAELDAGELAHPEEDAQLLTAALTGPLASALATAFLRALDAMGPEARRVLLAAQQLLLLPHCTRRDEELPAAVDAVVAMIKRSALPPPAAVTIARSAQDGYTPPHQAQLLEDLVLTALREELLPHWDMQPAALEVHDMAEDAEVKATKLRMLLRCPSAEALVAKRRRLEEMGLL